jgi:hypothetical protein
MLGLDKEQHGGVMEHKARTVEALLRYDSVGTHVVCYAGSSLYGACTASAVDCRGPPGSALMAAHHVCQCNAPMQVPPSPTHAGQCMLMHEQGQCMS